MTLDERIAECDRLEAGQRAEGIGLRAAKLGQGCFTYSRTAYLQARFEQGWRDGLSMAQVDAMDRQAAGAVPVV